MTCHIRFVPNPNITSSWKKVSEEKPCAINVLQAALMC